MPQYKKKYPRLKSMHKKKAARSGRDLIVSLIYEIRPTLATQTSWASSSFHATQVLTCLTCMYVYGSVQRVRSRLRACPRRIVIITSLKNNHMLDEQLGTTGNCVLQTDICHFSKDLFFWYTIDGYTHIHYVMTGTSGAHDEKRLPTQHPHRT